ncbi:MAG TPA: response regulator transcription factor [Candidatus Saccharimonadales bacterium]|jgi:DNA-binding response OmpR family regulator|nr:response regulator transcription factor [Candidatus Saccharimonadales bacterium]
MKILVVEDEEKLANSLKRGLVAEGYIVDIALDSSQAFYLVETTEYDLILLDWMIPGQFDGPRLIEKWKVNNKTFPILMLTAKGAIGDRVKGLDSGADDYLSKPFSFDELLARIRALLRRPREKTDNAISHSSLTLDPLAKTLESDGKTIHVTAKEFVLLEYLLRHEGEVISKDRLLNHVWDDQSRVQPNTVETFIAHLRKKLGTNSNSIETVRGYGYVIR